MVFTWTPWAPQRALHDSETVSPSPHGPFPVRPRQTASSTPARPGKSPPGQEYCQCSASMSSTYYLPWLATKGNPLSLPTTLSQGQKMSPPVNENYYLCPQVAFNLNAMISLFQS